MAQWVAALPTQAGCPSRCGGLCVPPPIPRTCGKAHVPGVLSVVRHSYRGWEEEEWGESPEP